MNKGVAGILFGFCAAIAAPAMAAVLTVDARTQPSAPETGYFHFGASTAPNGGTVGINNRYLTLAGKPWLPVMGEFHYSRVPNVDWETELLKMKAAGISIVSTYIFWNHHEEHEGRFVWTGDRDLRRFVTLCGKLGFKVIIRPGPWVHSESRFGGIPDWVTLAVPTRANDSVYLHYVARYWGEVALQLKGLLWKDGGPIIGMQLENEYNPTGPGQGRPHIAALKRLALAAGFDLPIYTVTGWDNAVYPPREVTPLFGGYADEPWGLSTDRNPPSEVYAFRFSSRVRGALGMGPPSGTPSDGDADSAHTPFLGAEFGGGVPTMYRRRPIMQPDDTAAMLPVQLGSGVNLYGYYMFHGGQNSPDHRSLEENTSIGAYNDLPIIDYDFQAPLGAYGQQHAVMNKLRPFHYFLAAFGAELAPMAVHAPAVISQGSGDLVTPRFSVRSLGDHGFLFFNNHVRQYPMAAQHGVQFSVQLPSGTVTFPSQPIDILSGAYFIWPINIDVGGARLVYATAQLVARLDGDVPVYIFHAIDGTVPEFAFDDAEVVTSSTGTVARGEGGRFDVTGVVPGTNATIDVKARGGRAARIVVLTATEAEHLVLPVIGGRTHAILTKAQFYQDAETLHFLSTGDPKFRLSIFPALAQMPSAEPGLRDVGADGVFHAYEASAVPRRATARLTKTRDAQSVPPLALGPPGNTAHEPMPETFGKSAAWSIAIGGDPLDGGNDALLRIRARGDVARLFAGATMIDDHFLDGSTWEIGLKRFAGQIGEPLMLTVLPLRKDAPIYLDRGVAAMVDGDQTADVTEVSVVPQYHLRVRVGAP